MIKQNNTNKQIILLTETGRFIIVEPNENIKISEKFTVYEEVNKTLKDIKKRKKIRV